MFSFTSKFIKTDVTCVKILPDYILAGVGGYLNIFDRKTAKVLDKILIFSDQKILGITLNSSTSKIILFGGVHLKFYEINNRQLKELSSVALRDWILCSTWLNNGDIAVVLMHNILLVLKENGTIIKTAFCEEKCILYSAFICNNNWEDLVILSGTVFSEVLVWKPKTETDSPVLSILKGHKGVIFCVHFNKESRFIASSSDDRSTILWSVKSKSIETPNLIIELSQKFYGHQSRIFQCLVLNSHLLTAGEDSIVNLWDFNGDLVRKIESHQGGAVWALDTSGDVLVTGGEDAGLTTFSLCPVVEKSNLVLEDGIPKLVTILRTGFNGKIYIYKEGDSNLELLCSHTNSSRIFSFHWLTCSLFLTCLNGGKLVLHFVKNKVYEVFTFELPKIKERWSVAACLVENNKIIVGDRKGNIYVYKLGLREPVQIIKKAHSYLGITKLINFKEGNCLVSLGRNSVVKKFTKSKFLQPLSSDKVPFTWLVDFCYFNNLLLLLAFSGDNFIVCDYSNRKILLEIPCGGGHRSWTFHKNKFIFIRDKIITICDINWEAVTPINFLPSYHIKAINGLEIIKQPNGYLIISGGEDTTLKVSSLIDNNLKIIHNLKSHLSSIRAICWDGGDLIFSAGGRGQIICWKLQTFSEWFSYYEPLSQNEGEVRVMDLTTGVVDGEFVLYAACSDGFIKTFQIKSGSLVNNYNVFYKYKCIIKVCFLQLGEKIFLVSLATDGNFAIWNILSIDKIVKTNVIRRHQSGVNSYSFYKLDDGVVFITGGDDNTIILSYFKLQNDCLEEVANFKDASSHFAQVTGVFICDKYFLTASIDQKVIFFKWDFSDSGNFIVEKLRVYETTIADIQGMKCILNDNDVDIFIYGNGLECLKLNLF